MRYGVLFLLFFCWSVPLWAGGYFPAGQDTGLPTELAWHLKYLEVYTAQKYACGRNIIVAHLDSGVNAHHPDLKGHIVEELTYDFGEEDTDVTDLLGHGTATAGLILQVAPCAKILPLKINVGFENYFENETVIKALEYLLSLLDSHPEIKILNASLVMEPDEKVAFLLEAIRAHGVIIVAPTGNDGLEELSFPASHEAVLAIGGLDEKGHLYWRSNTGPGLFAVAPATNIWAPFQDQDYFIYRGTSLSAALVSGILALLMEKNPPLPQLALAEGAKDLGEPGYDNSTGFGAVSALETLSAFYSRQGGIFPKRIVLHPEEKGFLVLWPTGDWKVTFTNPEIVKVRDFSPEKGLIYVVGKKPGQSKIFLTQENLVLTAEIEVSIHPQAVAEFLLFPRISYSSQATMCFWFKNPTNLSGNFSLILTKSINGIFEKKVISFEAQIPPGTYFDCWALDLPEETTEILFWAPNSVKTVRHLMKRLIN